MTDHDITINRRHGDSVVQVIAQKLESLHGDVGEMRSILRELTTAVTKLAVIEERQGQASQAQERAFKEIEKNSLKCDFHHAAQISETKILASRVATLEQLVPTTKQTGVWVASFITGLAVLALLFVANKVGLS